MEINTKEHTFTIIGKTMAGLEGVLADEIGKTGGTNITALKRAVSFEGNMECLYRANLWSATALSFLVPLADGEVNDQQDLYNLAKSIAWDDYMSSRKTFSISAVAFHNDKLTHSKFVALKVKDALADYFREKYGIRPSVDNRRPDILINVHISGNKGSISLNSSGDPLYKRGYRMALGKAPLSEVLAAGMVRLSEWDAKSPLHDPMCGSGTIALEAGLLAANIAPGSFRHFFSFMKWRGYNKDLWMSLKEEAEKGITNPGRIIKASDINPLTISSIRKNIESAGLQKIIKIEIDDFFKSSGDKNEPPMLIMNPPYGERVKNEDPQNFFKQIGDTLKNNYAGSTAWIIAPPEEMIRNIGLKPHRKIILYNGQIECRFARFDLFKGSQKEHKTQKNTNEGNSKKQ